MKLYYAEETITNLEDQCDFTREEAIDCAMDYFESNFTKEELLELLVRGQVHADEDKRVPDDFFNR